MQNPRPAILYTKILSVAVWFALIAQFGIRSFIWDWFWFADISLDFIHIRLPTCHNLAIGP